MSRLLRLIALLILLFPVLCTAAEEEEVVHDSLEASFLTCSPGQEIYQYYGHTGLRIRNVRTDEDAVFDYGRFNFRQPNFMWKFILGDTQYFMGAAFTQQFLMVYAERGSFVREMKLNLTQAEVNKLLSGLRRIFSIDDWTYPYNFFYDNCATRIRDDIEACLDGKLVYRHPVKKQSLRDIVHEYSKNYKWSLFGQDLLLGAEADKEAPREVQQFAPLYLEKDLSTAQIVGADGSSRPLVKEVNKLVEEQNQELERAFPLTPMQCSLILLAVVVAVTLWDFLRKRRAWIFDTVLLTVQGMAGLLIAFMLLFSQHPTVGSNWHILWLNPLPLVFLYWIIKKERRMERSRYRIVESLLWLLFMIAVPLIPQNFPPETRVLALCLFIRSLCCGPFINFKNKQL